MEQQIYNSDRYFVLFDVLVSHGQFLLRSQKDDKISHNIDVIFFDTAYIQVFSKLNGMCIRKVSLRFDSIQYNTVSKYLSYDNNNLFEIESNNEKYYIAASYFSIFENQLDFNETSLGYENKGRSKEIVSSRR